MEGQIGGGQSGYGQGDAEIAPVARRQDVAPDDQAQPCQIEAVEDQQGEGVDSRHRQGQASDGPKPEQPRQRRSREWRATGPVRHCGQKKTADDGADIAEQHLVDMPVHPRATGDPSVAMRQNIDPERRRHRSPQGAEQEEGPKP